MRTNNNTAHQMYGQWAKGSREKKEEEEADDEEEEMEE